MADGTKDGANVVILPPLLFVILVIAGEALQLVWPLGFATGSGVRMAIGLALIAVAAPLVLGAFRLFRRMGQDPNPTTPTPALTRAGPYRFTRNPMYVAGGLLQLGVGIARGNGWIVLAMIPGFLIMHYGVILREEAYLARKFGAAYLDYARAVRRWL